MLLKKNKNIKIDSLRSKMSYISQDIFLLNGTLRENLQSKKMSQMTI